MRGKSGSKSGKFKAWRKWGHIAVDGIRRMEIDLAGAQEEADVDNITVVKRDFVDVAKDWKKLLIVFAASRRCRGTVGLLVIVKSSGHCKERSLHTVGGMCLGIIGCVVMATAVSKILRYDFANVCMAGVFVGGHLLAVWLAGNTPWKGTRSVMMGVNGWSNIAGVIARQIFNSKYAPRRGTPHCNHNHHGLRYLRAKYLYKTEHKKRADEIACWDEAQFAAEAVSRERRGNQKRTFMYGS
ncbi:hypothetical protein CSAL01_06670 [Colletotrichum salicis]|uniref:Uncharacterized protein n=1 Tax=Colletotrichum salicis TaxID=1209931 RepID=A0A135UKR6_9PEZI|nr:hypothetical protein CSAL01_06670 [Colletotrichum salicis]